MRERWLGWSVAGEISRQQNTYAALQHIYLQPEDLRKLSLMARTPQRPCHTAGNYHVKVPLSVTRTPATILQTRVSKISIKSLQDKVARAGRHLSIQVDLHYKAEPFQKEKQTLNSQHSNGCSKVWIFLEVYGHSPSPLCLLKICVLVLLLGTTRYSADRSKQLLGECMREEAKRIEFRLSAFFFFYYWVYNLKHSHINICDLK